MKRSKFAAAAGAAFAGVGFSCTNAFADSYKWKMGNDFAVDHPMNVRMRQAADKIRDETQGRLDIQIFPNLILGGVTQMLSQLRLGAIEMLCHAGGIMDTVVPVASIESVAFAFKDSQTAFAAMDGELGAVIREGIAQKGMLCLERAWDNGLREFTTSTKPIRTVGDLQGMKLRSAPGKLRVDSFRALGCIVTPISPNEVYTALQTKLVDGQETTLLYILTEKFYEVQKYCSLTHHMWGGHWTLINQEKWAALPSAYQDVVRRYTNEAAILQRHDDEVLDRTVREKLAGFGLIFNEPSQESFRAKLIADGYYTRWRAEFGERAWRALEKYSGRLG